MTSLPIPCSGRGLRSLALSVCFVVLLAAGLADGVLRPFLALWAVREAGVPVAATGLLLGCYAGGELVATPFVGGLSDRLGRRPVLIAATTGVGAFLLLLGRTHGAVAAALCLGAVGLFESALHPTVTAMVADVVPEAELRRRYGTMRVASGVGDVLGPACGALLVGASLRPIFPAAGLTLLAAAALVVLALPETRRTDAAGGGGDHDDDDFGALAAVFRDRRLAALLLPFAAIELVTSWFEAVVPLAATGARVLNPAEVGFLFAGAGLLGLALQAPATRMCRRWPAGRVAVVAGVALGGSFAALALRSGLPGLVAAATGFAIVGVLLGPLVPALVMATAPVRMRGTYAAALSTVADLRDAAGPALGTALFAAAAALPWLVGLAIGVGATVGLARTLRTAERGAPDVVEP